MNDPSPCEVNLKDGRRQLGYYIKWCWNENKLRICREVTDSYVSDGEWIDGQDIESITLLNRPEQQ